MNLVQKNMSEVEVAIANTILNSCFELSVVERNTIFLTLAEMSRKGKVKEVDYTKWYYMEASEYASLRNIKPKHAYEVLKTESARLFDRYIVVKYPGKTTLHKIRWVTEIRFNDERHRVELRWSQTIVEFISALSKDFTRFRVEDIVKIDSKYTARLYDLLLQRKFKGLKGKIRVPVEWIIEHWSVAESSREYKFLKSRVLVPAIKELKNKGLCNVELKDTGPGLRVSRFVENVEFTYEFPEKDKGKDKDVEGFEMFEPDFGSLSWG